MKSGLNDLLLLPYVHAVGEAERERLLAVLVSEHAEPIISKICRFKSRSNFQNGAANGEAEDVQSEVMLHLIGRLQNLRFDYETRPIADFKAYVAVAAYNAFDRHISRKYPQRRRLKNGLRYLLTHREKFACWQTSAGAWVGGFERWREHNFVGERGRKHLQMLNEDARAFVGETMAAKDWHEEKNAVELLTAIFEWTNAPVELDLLTGVVAVWWNVTDATIEIDGNYQNENPAKSSLQIADTRTDIAAETEQRAYLKKLWTEIIALPPRQRAALLLNLRDANNRGIVDLWLLTNVCTVQSIADALEITPPELAELWKDLPFDDNRIAAHLNLTRQQVINLRKSARERLARRMKD